MLCQIHKLGAILGFYPGFVFDRGFWIPIVMKWMLAKNITFYLRIKQGQQLDWLEKKDKGSKRSAFKIGKFTKDTLIKLFGFNLRLVISPPPPKSSEKGKKQSKERWYILTNDLTSSRDKVLDIYRHRFEIEETFKDLKYVSRLKKFFIKLKLSFRILLFFACLSFWIAYWCSKLTQLADDFLQTELNPKKRKSYFKIWWETIQRLLRVNLKLLDLDTG